MSAVLAFVLLSAAPAFSEGWPHFRARHDLNRPTVDNDEGPTPSYLKAMQTFEYRLESLRKRWTLVHDAFQLARAALERAAAIRRAASSLPTYTAGPHGSAVGVVSWYDCSSQETASGYQYANGAAWFYSGGLNLPFGTVVHASYRGYSTNVIVTDTGLGRDGWLMDFCPDAFADLAPLSAGWIDGVALSW